METGNSLKRTNEDAFGSLSHRHKVISDQIRALDEQMHKTSFKMHNLYKKALDYGSIEGLSSAEVSELNNCIAELGLYKDSFTSTALKLNDALLQAESYSVKSQAIDKIAEIRQGHFDDGKTIVYDKKHNTKGQLFQAALYVLHLNEGHYPADWSSSYKQKIAKMNFDERLLEAAALLAANYDCNNKVFNEVYELSKQQALFMVRNNNMCLWYDQKENMYISLPVEEKQKKNLINFFRENKNIHDVSIHFFVGGSEDKQINERLKHQSHLANFFSKLESKGVITQDMLKDMHDRASGLVQDDDVQKNVQETLSKFRQKVKEATVKQAEAVPIGRPVNNAMVAVVTVQLKDSDGNNSNKFELTLMGKQLENI